MTRLTDFYDIFFIFYQSLLFILFSIVSFLAIPVEFCILRTCFCCIQLAFFFQIGWLCNEKISSRANASYRRCSLGWSCCQQAGSCCCNSWSSSTKHRVFIYLFYFQAIKIIHALHNHVTFFFAFLSCRLIIHPCLVM